MHRPTLPLAGHLSFRASNAEELADAVYTRLRAKCIAIRGNGSLDAHANSYALPAGELWFCSYGVALQLHFAEGPCWRVQFQYSGRGATILCGQRIALTAHQACVTASDAIVDLGADFQKLVWHIDRGTVARKLVALTGQPIGDKPRLDSTLRLDTPMGKVGRHLLASMLATIESAGAPAAAFLLAELEQSLIVNLLCTQCEDFRQLITRTPVPATPLALRRAMEYLDAHVEQPLDISDLAAHCGTSIRSLYRAFRKYLELSPLEFLKQRRLLLARRKLEYAEPTLTVTQAAFSCGFNDISHFSRDFSRAFGASPSALLRRRK
jgi:AraC-like DNA-binding protein